MLLRLCRGVGWALCLCGVRKEAALIGPLIDAALIMMIAYRSCRRFLWPNTPLMPLISKNPTDVWSQPLDAAQFVSCMFHSIPAETRADLRS